MESQLGRKYCDTLPPIALFLIILFYCFCIISHSSSVLMSQHGLYHSSYIYQIMNGIVPPTNPQAAGAPANVYWPWHCMIAILSKHSALSPLEAGALINTFCFAISTVILYKLGRNFFSMPISTAAIISISAFFFMAYPYVLYSSLHNLMPDTFIGYNSLYSKVLHTKPLLRGISICTKFTNQTSFASVMCFFCAGLYLDTKKGFNKSIKDFLLELIIFLFLGLYNPIALFVFDFWAVSVALATFCFKGTGEWLKLLWRRYIHLVFINILLLPYVIYLAENVGGERYIGFDLNRSLHLNGNVFLLCFWFIITAVLVIRGRKELELRFKSFYFYLTALVIMINVLHLPDRNEYKISLLASIPAVFLLYETVTFLFSNRKHMKLFLKGVVVILTLYSMRFRIMHYWQEKPSDPLTSRGNQIRLNLEGSQQEYALFKSYYNTNTFAELQDMCDWIRENTAREAYIMRRPVGRNLMLEPVLAQRRLFVTLPSMQTQEVEGFQQLFDLNEKILNRVRCEGGEGLSYEPSEYSVIIKSVGSLNNLYVLVENNNLKAHNTKFMAYQNRSYSLFRFSEVSD